MQSCKAASGDLLITLGVVPPVRWPWRTGRHQTLTKPHSTAAGTRLNNMFGRLKDWRRLRTRYDRCAHTFVSAISSAAIVIFWMGSIDHREGSRDEFTKT